MNKDACSHCASKKANEISKTNRANKYFKILDSICKKNKYVLITKKDEFKDIKMNIQFICPKHGIQTMMLDNFIRGHKCISCSYESRFDSMKISKSYIKKYISQINGNTWLNPEEHTNTTDRNLKIRCKCGNIYVTSFTNFVRAGINRCPKCSQKESSGEKQIREFLESNDIKFIQEKRFLDCKDKKPLPFDFYLPLYNMCIEFDGKHHFHNIYGDNALHTTQFHDKIKDDYCLSHNIGMVRIPYWEGNNIDSILKNNLNI